MITESSVDWWKGGRAGQPQTIPTVCREVVRVWEVVQGKGEVWCGGGGGGGRRTYTGKIYRIIEGGGCHFLP